MTAGDAQTAGGHFENALAIERRTVGNSHPDVGLTLLGSAGPSRRWRRRRSRACLEEALCISLLENGIGLRDASIMR